MVVCVQDACGWLMFLFIYGIMAYSDYVIIYWVAYKHLSFESIWSPVIITVFNASLLCLALSHIRTVFADPGRVPFPYDKSGSLYRGVALLRPADGTAVASQNRKRGKWITNVEDEEASEIEAGATNDSPHALSTAEDATQRKIIIRCMKNDWTECRRCHMLRPPRSHHCRTCKRCIRRMDHHCPWVNNCVGAENQKYFLQFLFWTALSTFFAGSATVWSWISSDCNGSELFSIPQKTSAAAYTSSRSTTSTSTNCTMTEFEQQNRILHAILILMICALFFIFSTIMFVDQVSCIMHDRSTVEKASGEEWERQMTSFDKLREVCGRSAPFCWLMPCFSRKLLEHERFVDFTVDIADDDDDGHTNRVGITEQQTTAFVDEGWHASHPHTGVRRQNVNEGVDGGGCVEEMRPLASCTRAGGATGDDSDDNNDEDSRFVV